MKQRGRTDQGVVSEVAPQCPYTRAYSVAPDQWGDGGGLMLEAGAEWKHALYGTGPYLDALWFRDLGLLTIAEHAPE